MKVTEKFLKANREKLKKINNLGLNRNFGKKNPRWKGGNRLKGNYPCPQCGKDRICEKRNSYRICKDCWNNRQSEFDRKKWYQKIQKESKEHAIMYKGGKCEACGVDNLPACCYCFHHVNPIEKKFHLGTMFHQKINNKVIKELDKCKLLCLNCHAIIHWGNNDHDNRESLSYS